MRKAFTNPTAFLGRFLVLTAAVLALVAGAAPAKADEIYTTNATPGTTPPTFVSGSGFLLGPGDDVYAESFVPTETATLTDVELPLFVASIDDANVVTVYIESSTAGGAPTGTILDTLGPTGNITNTTGLNTTVTCATCTVLTAGTTYFVVVAQTQGADVADWNEISPTISGTVYPNTSGGTTSFDAGETADLAAFEVDGTPVTSTPEPGTAGLTLAGIGMIAVLMWKRRQGALRQPQAT